MRPPGGAAESQLDVPAPRGPVWNVGVEPALCASALRARSIKMALVEHVVADAGAFLRDAALQVRRATAKRSRDRAGPTPEVLRAVGQCIAWYGWV